MISLDDSLENLWIEGKDKNKKTPNLIEVVCQRSSENANQIEWIEKLMQFYL